MDKNYWVAYYENHQAPIAPSDFAVTLLEDNLIKPGAKLLELGCGNGRDSIYFAKNGVTVSAVDQAENAISRLQDSFPYIHFTSGDFIHTKLLEKVKFDYIYSRFTIHTITLDQESMLLKRVYQSLKDGGLFFIETRCIKDCIFGLGEKIGYNEFIYENHYRRFIVKEEMEKRLKQAGFRILLSEEKTGFAKYDKHDPVILRIIAIK